LKLLFGHEIADHSTTTEAREKWSLKTRYALNLRQGSALTLYFPASVPQLDELTWGEASRQLPVHRPLRRPHPLPGANLIKLFCP
jgi:hypothetical protein